MSLCQRSEEGSSHALELMIGQIIPNQINIILVMSKAFALLFFGPIVVLVSLHFLCWTEAMSTAYPCYVSQWARGVSDGGESVAKIGESSRSQLLNCVQVRVDIDM
jgi:hypothetical protein